MSDLRTCEKITAETQRTQRKRVYNCNSSDLLDVYDHFLRALSVPGASAVSFEFFSTFSSFAET